MGSELKDVGATGMVIDGLLGTEHLDSSGEVLDVKGADITLLEEGKGTLNFEHRGHNDNEKGGKNGEEVVGKVLWAKKLFSRSDCANERERMYWDQCKVPCIYGVCRLFDGAGHPGAQSIAAGIRDAAANDEPITISWSVEGSTLDRKDNVLKETLIRKVALTWSPCNKATALGLLQDPNAPKGFPKMMSSPDLAAAVKSESDKIVDPMFQRLGGTSFVYGPDMLKALAAGNYNAAPGTRTGGAALQVEDQTLKARAMAARRDWNKSGKFRDFLKSRLPEVSEEFLDHYSDLVESHTLRLKKTEEVLADLKKRGVEPKKPGSVKRPALSDMVVQGKPVPASNQRFSSFDPVSESVITPKGIFKISMPDAPHPHLVEATGRTPEQIKLAFHREMEKQRPHHLRAMQSWMKMNDNYVHGKVSPQVLAHAVAFSMLSPGIPVYMQEHMYGHFVDALKEHGLSGPQAKGIEKVLSTWQEKNRSGLPQHSREHFIGLENALGFKIGHHGFQKPNIFAENFGQYMREHHDEMTQLLRSSGGNSHAMARKLTEVKGIAPKIARYMLGMLGAGDVVVPDTHFIRHLFGLRPESRPGETTPDGMSREHIRTALTEHAQANDILEGIDGIYSRHPAVRHVLNDKALGPYFKGREDQAIFPGFWRHWISIDGHEKFLGTPNFRSFNPGTDHAPFWNAVQPFLKKAEESQQFDPDLAMRTAAQHHRWIEQYGSIPALGLYYRYLVPQLIQNDQNQVNQLVQKAENLSIMVRRALGGLRKDEQGELKVNPPSTVQYQGKTVRPGILYGNPHSSFALLAADKEFVGVPALKFNTGKWDHNDIVRIPRNYEGAAEFKSPFVVDYPELVDQSDSKVDLNKHGVGEFNSDPETFSLAHGFDVNGPKTMGTYGVNKDVSYWAKSANGKRVYVKADDHAGAARLEGAYVNLARNFFGLGDLVPRVAVFRHPHSGREHAMIEGVPGVPGVEAYYAGKTKWSRENADTLHKAALMNAVLGNQDRHGRNYLWSPEHGLKLIDHGAAFAYSWLARPHYMDDVEDEHIPRSDAVLKWFRELKSEELASQMQRLEMHPRQIHLAQWRLKAIQDALDESPNILHSNLVYNLRSAQSAYLLDNAEWGKPTLPHGLVEKPSSEG